MALRIPLLVLALTACGDSDIPLGAEGGECRISLTPCDGELICRDGGCRELREEDVEESLGLEVSTMRADMVADGRDTTALRYHVWDRVTGLPYRGEIRAWAEPPGAGYLRDGSMALEEGVGLTQFTACDARDRECPAIAQIRFAPARWPQVYIGAQVVRLAGGNTFGMPIGVPGQMNPPEDD